MVNPGQNGDGGVVFSDQLVPICLPKLVVTTDEQTGAVTKTVGYPSVNDAGQLVPAEGDFLGMDSIAIDPVTGIITGTSKDTKEVITIGVIAMGNVTNPSGVTHLSGPYYQANMGAGDLQISLMGGVASSMRICNKVEEGTSFDDTEAFVYVNQSMAGGADAANGQPDGMLIFDAGTTELMTGGLEMSKTDLATEISEMITTQRGYQANTRIITVTDSMLEELVNLKR